MDFFPRKIQDKFTTHLKNVIRTAERVSGDFKHKSIGIEHIVLGIISQRGSIGSNFLGTGNVDFKKLHNIIDKMPKTRDWKPRFSDELKNVFKKAVLIASKYRHIYIGTEHLLYAVLLSKDKKTLNFLSSIGIKRDNLKESLVSFMKSSSKFSEMVESFSARTSGSTNYAVSKDGIRTLKQPNNSLNDGFMLEMPVLNQTSGSRQSALDFFCVDLVEKFKEGKIDPIIGRDKEINKLVNILSRKTKNNPILVGEPGVGKTAIVQGFAQRILHGRVPVNLLNKRIYSLDVGLLVAGAVFRGEFEARLKDVLNEVQGDPNVILFIDEIHTIIGAGSASGSGSLDAANIIKPSLSRGDISCIGATTLDEYRKHFKRDAAFERRFQIVVVEEPSVRETKKMLKDLKGVYEEYHKIKISDDAVEAAVDLSRRFINDRFLPDKAFDVLDEASVLLRSRHTGKNYFKEIRKMEEGIRFLQKEKEKAIENEEYDKALMIKEKESESEKGMIKLYKIQEKENKTKVKASVSVGDVMEVITQMTGIPVGRLVSDERKKLRMMEDKLKKYIVGQDEAIAAISRSIRRSRSGIANTNRPVGVFAFLGPTGVGKTELVKVLSKEIYERTDSLIKVNMSEFMERHNVSRLVGAPAGYVGYEEGGKLTEQVRLHPYSIVLFDEIEKAHPDVFNLLLQIFDEGELIDAAGRKTDFRNTIIILTSNIGTEQLNSEAKWGFCECEELDEKEKNSSAREKYIKTKEVVLKEFKDEFSPEFVNRIDKIIVFNPLSVSDIRSIVKIQFEDFQSRLLNNGNIKISMTKRALDYISRRSFNHNEGARLVKRNLQEMVEDLVSEDIIDEKVKSGDVLRVDVVNEKVVLKTV